MQIQSKALPQSFSLRGTIHNFAAASDRSHPMLVFTVVVLLALFAIVQIDLHSAQLQAMGLVGQAATGLNPVFLGP